MSTFVLTPAQLPTLLQKFSVLVLRMCGWRVRFAPLPGPRGVAIVYPHTSNWDFFYGLLAKWAIGVPFHWLGKPSLFGWGLGAFMRAVGGEPIERGSSTGAIARLAQRIRAADSYWLALTPEGTRAYRSEWRSGFYHIALAARVPLGFACIDYRAREVRFMEYVTLTGDLATDLAAIRAQYPAGTGRHPSQEAPIVFASPAAAPVKANAAGPALQRLAQD